MQTLAFLLQKKFEKALRLAFAEHIQNAEHLLPEVVHSTLENFGHYQCNNALKLSKLLNEKPREIAEKIISSLDLKTEDGNAMIAHVEIAGPGFINITLDPSFLSGQVDEMLKSPRLGIPLPSTQKKVIVEFSSPNIAKELHVGHLRSTIIGDSLARLFEFLGYDVLRLNHIGDWGTQFGMLIAYLQEKMPQILSGDERADLPALMQWYKESKKLFDEDPEFKKRAQLQVVKLQGGETASLEAWKMICNISRRSFQEIYDLLDVDLIERGESFYNPYLQDIVDDLDRRDMITLSEGAKCIFLEGFQSREGKMLPIIIQKSDGGFNYDTTDMAALRHRIEVEKASRIIIVTDAGQSLHFQMIFKAAEKAGYLDPQKVQVDHVPFGVVLGADGKKFKTRSGDVERLIDLLLEAIDHAKNILKQRL
ncbi:MAG: arginine--tRNA ligase, partial [Anaerolineae bacterium]